MCVLCSQQSHRPSSPVVLNPDIFQTRKSQHQQTQGASNTTISLQTQPQLNWVPPSSQKMKLSTVLLPFFVSIASANKEGKTISPILDALALSYSQLTTSLSLYTNPTSGSNLTCASINTSPIISLSHSLLDSISSTIPTISSSEVLNVVGVGAVGTSIRSLATTVNETMEAFLVAQPQLQEAGLVPLLGGYLLQGQKEKWEVVWDTLEGRTGALFKKMMREWEVPVVSGLEVVIGEYMGA